MKILIDLIDAVTELFMAVLRALFHIGLGICAVVMVLMLIFMIAYIIKVCFEELVYGGKE